MTELLTILLPAVIGIIIGFFFGNRLGRLKSASESGKLEERLGLVQQQLQDQKDIITVVEKEREQIRLEKDALSSQLATNEADYRNLEEKLKDQKKELAELQEHFTKEFENLANKILEEKSSKFTKQNKENLENLLDPLKEKIRHFEKRVEETNKESHGRHSELKQQLKLLRDLNQQISKEADNLTKALKGDSKLQGNWGELVLTRILEKSGLEEGREYSIQDSHTNEEGRRLQTDVLIHLPDGKKMIIDSKVSLVDFERFVSEEDEQAKQVHLKKHITSIRKHVNDLSNKKYHHLIEESPDTVFMFIPIEPAFAIAAANEANLYEDAFDKQVIIVTPSTLLAALRLVDNLWQNDRQKKNALEIARQAGSLYDQFTNLTDELVKVGKQIGTVQGTYESAMKKLTGRGNLIRKVEKLKKLGAKASKNIDDKLLKRAEEDS